MVIPLAPGETAWPGLMAQLGEMLGRDCEVVVAATDPQLAMGQARVVVSAVGRALQLNAGAAAAEGAWLWFLHADTRLFPESFAALERFIATSEPALGWFDLRFREDGPAWARWNARGANFRSRLGMPFGDQGFVIPATLFRALGGFDTQAAYGEDHLFAWAVRRAGFPLRAVGACLSTSARKYARNGWLRTTARHVWLTAIQAWPQWWAWRRGR